MVTNTEAKTEVKTAAQKVDEATSALSQEFLEIETEMQSMTVGMCALSKRLKKLERAMHEVIKKKMKKQKSTKNETATPIDNRLMKFMGLSEPLTTRSEALRRISDYVRTTGLQVPDDKRTFKTDNTLASLFGIPKGEKLTFLAINKHITPLFNKNAVPVPVTTVKSSKSKKGAKSVEK